MNRAVILTSARSNASSLPSSTFSKMFSISATVSLDQIECISYHVLKFNWWIRGYVWRQDTIAASASCCDNAAKTRSRVSLTIYSFQSYGSWISSADHSHCCPNSLCHPNSHCHSNSLCHPLCSSWSLYCVISNILELPAFWKHSMWWLFQAFCL